MPKNKTKDKTNLTDLETLTSEVILESGKNGWSFRFPNNSSRNISDEAALLFLILKEQRLIKEELKELRQRIG